MHSSRAYYLILKTGISNLELEKIISKSCTYSYCYARNVLKDRFKLGELAISKHVFYSYDYAISVLKCRFRLGEEIIIKYTNFNYYCEYLVKGLRYNHE